MSIPNLLREELRGMLAGRYDAYQQGNLRSLIRAMCQQTTVAGPQTMQPHPLETRVQVLTDGVPIDDRAPLNLLLRAIRCHAKVVSLEDQIAELEVQILQQRALFGSQIEWEKRHAISKEKMLVEKQQKLKAQCDSKSTEAQQYTAQVETRLDTPFVLPIPQPRAGAYAFTVPRALAQAPVPAPRTPPRASAHAFAMPQPQVSVPPPPRIPPRASAAVPQVPLPPPRASVHRLLPPRSVAGVAPRPTIPFEGVLPRAFDPNAKLPPPPDKGGFSLFNLRPSSLGRKKGWMVGGLLKRFSSEPNVFTTGDDDKKGKNSVFSNRYQELSEISHPISPEQLIAAGFPLLSVQKKSTRRNAPLSWNQFPPPHLAPLIGQERLPQARDRAEDIVIRQAQTGRVFLPNSTVSQQSETLRDVLLVYENNLADLNPNAIVDFNSFLCGIGLRGAQTRLPIATVNVLLQIIHEIILIHPALSNLQTTLTILMSKDLGQVPVGYPPQDQSLRLSDLFPLDQVTPPFLSTSFGQYYINAFTNKAYRGSERHNLRFVLLNFVEVLRQLAAFASVCLTRLSKEDQVAPSNMIDRSRGGVQRRDRVQRRDGVQDWAAPSPPKRHDDTQGNGAQRRDWAPPLPPRRHDNTPRGNGVQRRGASPLPPRRHDNTPRENGVQRRDWAPPPPPKRHEKALVPNFDLAAPQHLPQNPKLLSPQLNVSQIPQDASRGEARRVSISTAVDPHARMVGVNSAYRRAEGRWDNGKFIPGQVVNGEFEPITSSLTAFSINDINHAVSDIAYVAGFPEDINRASPERANEIHSFARYIAYELERHTIFREFDGSKFTFDSVLLTDPRDPSKKAYRLKPEKEFAPHYRFRDIKSASATMVTYGAVQGQDIYLPLRMNNLVVGGQQVGKALSLPKLVNMDKFYNYLFEENVPAVHMLLQEMDFNGAEIDRMTNQPKIINNEKVPDWHYPNNMPRYHIPVTDYHISDGKIHMHRVGMLAPDGSKGKNIVCIPPSGFFTPDNGMMYVESRKGRVFNLGEESETQEYRLILTKNGVTREVKLLHSPSWKDMTAIQPDQLQKLLNVRKIAFAGMPLSDVVTHCRAGVGRTGTLLAAEAMTNLGTSLLETVASLRDSRCGKMVQTPTQGEALTLWAMSRGLPIISDVSLL